MRAQQFHERDVRCNVCKALEGIRELCYFPAQNGQSVRLMDERRVFTRGSAASATAERQIVVCMSGQIGPCGQSPILGPRPEP